MAKNDLFEVILGTTEEFLVGYKFNDENIFTQSFASHSHVSSVRCVAFSNYLLASGGADDRIVIYDMRTRKEHCLLTHHNSTINCLQFTPDGSHIVSGSSDGTLAIVRVGNWKLEKLWEKAHKGFAVEDVAIHNSGKLALTLGVDATLRTWNLIKGRQAYAINLNSKCKNAKSLQGIKWSPDGVHFVLYGGNVSDIWSIESGGIVTNIEHKDKISSCIFLDEQTLLVGFENGKLLKFDSKGNKINKVNAHSGRVKAMDIQGGYLATCSSSGEVKMWDQNFENVSKCDTGCRNTCMILVPPINEIKM